MNNIWNKEHNFTDIGLTPEVSVGSFGMIPLFKELLSKSSGHLSEMLEEGYVKDDAKNGQSYIDIVSSLNGRLLYKYICDTSQDYIYLLDDGIIDVSISDRFYFKVQSLSLNEKFIVDLQKSITEIILPIVQHGHVFAIVSSGGRLALQTIGSAGIPLVKCNYTPKVIAGYEYIVQDLNSEHPSGRIAILEGPPGSGKTHMIRSLLLDIPGAMFVLVSPDMVSSLSGPELLPLLLGQKQSYSLTGPIILILEDADKCLVSRASDNIASIQALLNLGDGILGSLLDLRIVATTNAKKLEIEGAILRPGRLSKRIEVGALDYETATKVFSNLLPGKPLSDKMNKRNEYSLAEVYAFARECGWLPDAKDKSNLSDGVND